MSRLRKGRPSAWGLVIGHGFIGAAQVQSVGKGQPPMLSAASRVDRARPGAEPTAEEIGRAAEALWRQGFVGSDVVLLTPQDKIVSGVFDVPPRSSGAPLDQIARSELARVHKLEPSQLECGWWELPPGVRETEGTQVIATGCRVADAEALLQVCDEAGLEVRAMDAAGPALVRAVLARGKRSAEQLSAALQLGANASLLVVIRAGTIVYERVMEGAGLAAIIAPLCKKLSVDEETANYLLRRAGTTGDAPQLEDEKQLVEEAGAIVAEQADELASEVRASAAYAGRRYGGAVQRLLIAGEGASVPGLVARIGQRVGIEAELVSPGSQLEVGSSAEAGGMAAAPELTLSTGLALHREAA